MTSTDASGPPFPLTMPQRRIWLDQCRHGVTTQYNIGGCLRIDGALDAVAFNRAWRLLQQRHDALRLRLLRPAAHGELPLQAFCDETFAAIEEHDFSAAPAPEQAASQWMQQRFRAPFTLIEAPLWRHALLRVGVDRHYWFFCYHHLVADGWSIALLTRSLSELYNAPAMDGAAPSYRAFAEDDARWQASPLFERQRQYWRQRFAAPPEPLFDLPSTPATACGHATLRIAHPERERLHATAHAAGASMLHVMLAALTVYFARTRQRDEVVFGLPVQNRGNAAFKATAGLFVGISAAAVRFDPGLRFDVMLGRIAAQLKQDYRHQRMPPAAGAEPLYSVAVSWEKQDYDTRFGAAVGTALPLLADCQQTPLNLFIREFHRAGAADIDALYREDHFTRSQVHAMLRSLRGILRYVQRRPDAPLGEIPLVDAGDRARLQSWNRTAADWPRPALAPQRFARQVRLTPDAVALRSDTQSQTYRELERDANRVAQHLLAAGIGAESVVALCARRSPQLVAGLLGIQKAGAAWLPLDPDAPAARLQGMLDDARPAALLADDAMPPALRARVPVLALQAAIAGGPSHDPAVCPHPAGLAYVMYTSGSSGRPKAVAIDHAGLANRLCWMQRRYRLDAGDCVLQKTPYTFDVSVWEFLWPLTCGATLALAHPDAHHDPLRVAAAIARHAVTTVHFVPPMLALFLDTAPLAQCASLRRVVCSGEALPAELQRRFMALLPAVELHNLYGPTEASIDVTAWACRAGDRRRQVPIGRPIANIAIHILDQDFNALPPGSAGELYIAGVGLARGYLGRADLTAEKFLPDPFSPVPGARMYRSGDRARWLHDGSIEYLGRCDDQLKLAGVRIEPGEIEAALRALPHVREALVQAIGAGTQRQLAAWFTADAALEPAALQQALARTLPPQMVPPHLLQLAAMPLTAHGKIDRPALPLPLQPQHGAAPEGATEILLAGLWRTLLRCDRIDRGSHFFRAGGNSLVAMRLLVAVREHFGVELPLRAVFDAPLLAALARRIEQAGAGSDDVIRPAPAGASLPLSSAQQRLWFMHRLAPGNPVYNMAGGLRLRGALDAAALESALNAVLERQQALRTRIVETDGVPAQSVAAFTPLRLDVTDVSGHAADSAAGIAQALALQPFDLGVAPLLRACLLRVAADLHWLVLVLPHIAADGWSVEVLLHELASCYNGAAASLPALPIGHADHACWQQAQLARLEPERAYWRRQLDGAPSHAGLPTDRPHPAMGTARTGRGARIDVRIAPALATRLDAIAGAADATLFMTLLAAFGVLLWRHGAHDDFCIGTPVATRQRPELQHMVGCLVNLLALRLRLERNPGFGDLLRQVRATALAGYAHAALPFEQVVEALQAARDAGHAPLFQAMFSLQENAAPPTPFNGLHTEPLELAPPLARIELALELRRTGAGLEGHFEYSTDLFDAATIDRLAARFTVLLSAIAAQPDLPVGLLPVMPPAEQAFLRQLNQSQHAFPLHRTWVDLFAERVARHPARIVARCGAQQWCYRDLDRHSERVAAALVGAGAGRGTLVGVCARRDLWLPAMIAGIFKAGAAYVPLDPGHPPARLRDAVRRAGIGLLLACGDTLPLAALAAGDGGTANRARVIDVESLPEPASPSPPCGHPDDLAYVIFTSGSTGEPKGAMVQQSALLNNLLGKAPVLGLGAADRVAQTAPIAFDISVWQLLAAPLLGGAIDLLPDAVAADPAQLLAQLAARGDTVLQVVPSMLRYLVALPPHGLSLRWLLCIGEALPPALAQAWLARYPKVPLLNFYGPAECADNVACQVLRTAADAAALQDLAAVPIGYPTANLRLHVMDPRLQPLPVGVPGEICIAGAGLGLGYLDDPAQTARAFVMHDGQRLYRSGDIGRYRADGAIDFLGRRDQQLKIRGQRVETGEIEAALQRHPAVAEAFVIARPGSQGETELLACWRAKAPADRAQLRAHVSSQLPSYMVPAHFIEVDAWPLNRNGKLDRHALAQRQPAATAHDTPAGIAEQRLAAIWRALLGRAEIGRDDNFFHIGGHSLLATRLVAAIAAEFGIELPLREVFDAPQLQALARRIERCDTAADNPLPLAAGSAAPLSHAQQRFWFLDQLDPGSGAYNIGGALQLDGQLELAPLRAALQVLVERHAILRTRYAMRDGEPNQIVEEPAAAPVPLRVSDLGADPAQAPRIAEREAGIAFDLARAPQLRAHLLRLGPQRHWLLLTLPHIAGDGWSLRILLRELAALYDAHARQAPHRLPAPALRYTDFAAWQQRHPAHAPQLAYWRRQLAGVPPLLTLPTDRPRPARPAQIGACAAFTLPQAALSRLRQLAQAADATFFMALLAAFAVLLSRCANQPDLCIGTPVANRTRRTLEPLVGCFINTLALRVDLRRNPSFNALLRQVRQTVRDARVHADLPFEQVVNALQPERRLCHAPLFQAMLVLQPDEPATLDFGTLRATVLDTAAPTARVDLTLTMCEAGRQAAFDYNPDLFDRATIERLGAHFATLLQAAAAGPDTPAALLPLLDAAQLEQQLRQWNSLPSARAAHATMHGLFEVRATLMPDHIAVTCDDQALTYGALNRQANRLAHRLRSHGVGPDLLVGLCVDRSPAAIVAMLAVLKAGGAYLPLDPALPAARLGWMIGDARPHLLLTLERLRHCLPPGAIPLVCIEHENPHWPDHNPAPRGSAANLAYAIYTSGSTGNPKGALIHHHALVNLVQGQCDAFRLAPGRRVLQWASFNFDASVSEIFTALASGANLFLAPPAALLPGPGLLHTLRRHRIELLTLTPSALAALPHADLPDLRTIVVAGEQCDHALIAPWLRRHTVINAYGPTEATVCATVHACVADGAAQAPIGRPLANTQAYILDDWMNPLPAGVTGHLYLAGAGLARGYLNRPDLTAERFVQNPFAAEPGARMYHTGDLARYRADGRIECLGRADRQLKLRGYRIEPGEIETALLRLDEVSDAAVLPHTGPDGAVQLLACVVPAPAAAATLAPDALRTLLQRSLPDYMVPARFVLCGRLPVNSSGKLDRAALEALASAAAPEAPPGDAPAGDTEQRIGAIWCALLGLPRAGRHDDFFHSGGHSLLAVRLAARIEQAFGHRLPVAQVFLSPSIAALAREIDNGASSSPLVVRFDSAAAGTRCFLLHPAGGTISCYRQLAQAIGRERPVYAIQSPEIAGLETGDYTFDTLCRRYTAHIVALCPHGPLCLAGWSLGGVLALHIAGLLEQQRREVELVGLYDSIATLPRQAQSYTDFIEWARRHVPAGVAEFPLQDAFLQRQYRLQQLHVGLLRGHVPLAVAAPLQVVWASDTLVGGVPPVDWLAYTGCVGGSRLDVVAGGMRRWWGMSLAFCSGAATRLDAWLRHDLQWGRSPRAALT